MINLKTVGGNGTVAERCDQCGGFWFEREPLEPLALDSISKVDVATPSYSLKDTDLVCPNDNALLAVAERSELPAGTQYWQCSDCDGTFYPKGQLAMITQWQHDINAKHIAGLVVNKSRTTLAVLLLIIGIGVTIAANQKTSFDVTAATEQVLPTSGPNIMTLFLLGTTYLAGTVLAVLGRRVSIVLVGWIVIILCLIGFAIIIFGS